MINENNKTAMNHILHVKITQIPNLFIVKNKYVQRY